MRVSSSIQSSFSQPLAQRRLHVAHELQRAALGLGRERLAHEELAQRLAEGLGADAAADRLDDALVARRHLPRRR